MSSCLRLHDYGAALAHLRTALVPEITYPHEHLKQAVLLRACAVAYRHSGEAKAHAMVVGLPLCVLVLPLPYTATLARADPSIPP